MNQRIFGNFRSFPITSSIFNENSSIYPINDILKPKDEKAAQSARMTLFPDELSWILSVKSLVKLWADSKIIEKSIDMAVSPKLSSVTKRFASLICETPMKNKNNKNINQLEMSTGSYETFSKYFGYSSKSRKQVIKNTKKIRKHSKRVNQDDSESKTNESEEFRPNVEESRHKPAWQGYSPIKAKMKDEKIFELVHLGHRVSMAGRVRKPSSKAVESAVWRDYAEKTGSFFPTPPPAQKQPTLRKRKLKSEEFSDSNIKIETKSKTRVRVVREKKTKLQSLQRCESPQTLTSPPPPGSGVVGAPPGPSTNVYNERVAAVAAYLLQQRDRRPGNPWGGQGGQSTSSPWGGNIHDQNYQSAAAAVAALYPPPASNSYISSPPQTVIQKVQRPVPRSLCVEFEPSLWPNGHFDPPNDMYGELNSTQEEIDNLIEESKNLQNKDDRCSSCFNILNKYNFEIDNNGNIISNSNGEYMLGSVYLNNENARWRQICCECEQRICEKCWNERLRSILHLSVEQKNTILSNEYRCNRCIDVRLRRANKSYWRCLLCPLTLGCMINLRLNHSSHSRVYGHHMCVAFGGGFQTVDYVVRGLRFNQPVAHSCIQCAQGNNQLQQNTGNTINCCVTGCPFTAHVPCAVFAGASLNLVESADGPLGIMWCPRHTPNKRPTNPSSSTTGVISPNAMNTSVDQFWNPQTNL
eukprot:GHVL01036825.1.p1 GENE.GHVL01036825.1~~GHVL01036825.1.p1  ORF type:complete len:734 (+),score=200.51 GHVL01036825.1:117-2204(+)